MGMPVAGFFCLHRFHLTWLSPPYSLFPIPFPSQTTTIPVYPIANSHFSPPLPSPPPPSFLSLPLSPIFILISSSSPLHPSTRHQSHIPKSSSLSVHFFFSMDDLILSPSSPSSLLSFSHSPPPPPPPPLQNKLQFLLQAQPHSWLYAIFWQTSHDDRSRPRLSWCHGHFHASDPRPRHHNSFLKGLESLVDDNLNDAEWFYVMSLTRTFSLSPDSSLLAKAFSSSSPLWLHTSPHEIHFQSCDRAKEASLHGIRTLICVPTPHGVLEMGSADIIPKNSSLIHQIKSLYGSSDLTPIVSPSTKQPEQVDFLDVDETISFSDIAIIATAPEVVGDEKPPVNSCSKSRKKDPHLQLKSYRFSSSSPFALIKACGLWLPFFSASG